MYIFIQDIHSFISSFIHVCFQLSATKIQYAESERHAAAKTRKRAEALNALCVQLDYTTPTTNNNEGGREAFVESKEDSVVKRVDRKELDKERMTVKTLRAKLLAIEESHERAMQEQAEKHSALLEKRIATAKEAIVDSVIARALRSEEENSNMSRVSIERKLMLEEEVASWHLTRMDCDGVISSSIRCQQSEVALSIAAEREQRLEQRLQVASQRFDDSQRRCKELSDELQCIENLIASERNHSHQRDEELDIAMAKIKDLELELVHRSHSSSSGGEDDHRAIGGKVENLPTIHEYLERISENACSVAHRAADAAVLSASQSRVNGLEVEVEICRSEIMEAEAIALDLDAAQRLMEERIMSQRSEIEKLRAAAAAAVKNVSEDPLSSRSASLDPLPSVATTSPLSATAQTGKHSAAVATSAAQSAVALKVASNRIQNLMSELATVKEQCSDLQNQLLDAKSSATRTREPGNAALQMHLKELTHRESTLQAALGVASERIADLQKRLNYHTQVEEQQQGDILELKSEVTARDESITKITKKMELLRKDVTRCQAKIRAKEAKVESARRDAREEAKTRAQLVTLRNRVNGLQKKLDSEENAVIIAKRNAREADKTNRALLRESVTSLESQLEAAHTALDHATTASESDQSTAKAIIDKLQEEMKAAATKQEELAIELKRKNIELSNLAAQQTERAARDRMQEEHAQRERKERSDEISELRKALLETRRAVESSSTLDDNSNVSNSSKVPREPEATALRVAAKRIQSLMEQIKNLQQKLPNGSSITSNGDENSHYEHSPSISRRSPMRRPLAPRNT